MVQGVSGQCLIHHSRFFTSVAPFWPIVSRDELNEIPYAPPLLLRTICLLAASMQGKEAVKLVEDIVDSLRQCFDAYELLALPSMPTLKAILLLLACPKVMDTSMLVAGACRMALILGCHRPSASNPTIYWSCIIAARWEMLKDPTTQKSRTLCFDLDSAPPSTEPNKDTPFGQIYQVLKEADPTIYQHPTRTPSSNASYDVGWAGDPRDSRRVAEFERHPSEMQSSSGLPELLRAFLDGHEAAMRSVAASLLETKHASLHLNPFHHIMRHLSTSDSRRTGIHQTGTCVKV